MQQIKPLLLFCAFALCSGLAMASHNVSGRIEYELTGNNSCLIRLITFTDPSAALVDRCEIDIEIWNAAGNTKIADILDIPRINGPAVDPNFPSLSCPNSTLGEYVTSTVKRNVYETTYIFPSADSYEIYYSDVSRIDNIINLSNSGSTSFFVNAKLSVNTNLAPNRSPVINNDTVLTACAQQPWFNNLDITDPDGDSLSFSLVNCLQYDPPSIPVPITATGFGFPGIVGGGYFRVGPMGNVLWDNASSMLGPYSYAVEIKEWRNGIQIGIVIYDAIVFVLPNNCLVSSAVPLPEALITAFPNPAGERVTVTERVDLLQLFDLQGKLLRQAANSDQLEVADIPVGTYLLRMNSPGSVRNIKVTISR